MVLFSILVMGVFCAVHGLEQMYDIEGTCLEEYRLAFLARAGNGESVYDAYISNQARTNCDKHYRNNDILDNWSNIEKVAFVLYENDVKVKQIIFNGAGTTYLSWFHHTKLHDFTLGWADMQNETYNFFSIAGDHRPTSSGSGFLSRRFYINRNYGGCGADRGWFVVIDIEDPPCDWEHGRLPYPSFLYSKGHSVNLYDNKQNVGAADVMAIYVKEVSP